MRAIPVTVSSLGCCGVWMEAGRLAPGTGKPDERWAGDVGEFWVAIVLGYSEEF